MQHLRIGSVVSVYSNNTPNGISDQADNVVVTNLTDSYLEVENSTGVATVFPWAYLAKVLVSQD